MTVFEDIARCVDTGLNGSEAIQWSRLLYLPYPMTPERNVSRNVKTWIQLSDFEAAFDDQIAKIKKIKIHLSLTNGAIDGISIQTAAAVTGHGVQNHLHSRKQLVRLGRHTKALA